MQYQSPNSNNPCNPLFKSAALTLSRDNIARKKNAYYVIARLTFKFSNDLKGVAIDNNGEEITVCFSLSIKRASFQLSFSPDNPKVNLKRFLRLSKIAHHSSLATTMDITSYAKSNTQSILATTAVRSISEQIQLVSYLRSNAFSGVMGKRLI